MVQTSFLNKYTTSVLISICKAHRYIDDIICQGCHLSKIAEMTSYFYFHIIAIFYPDRRVWNFYRKKVLIMPKKKKKTMAVHEMAELLGLKKTDSYWLIHKQKFQTITVNGKTRVVIESFEKWYANQVKYKKAGGPPPGEELRRNTYSPQEIAELLGIDDTTVYLLI
jgi:predicted DNA-binding transcriptional regulator AlpA